MIEDKQFKLDENQPSNLTDWKKEPSILSLKQDLESAKTAHDSQMAKITRWNDLMQVKGSAAAPKVKGRSSIQPKLIRRQAEWRYAALTEPFTSSDRVFQITPKTFEDEKAAKQNELVLNWQFRTKINLIKFTDDFVRGVVDEGTGIVQVGWERHTVMVKEEAPVFEHYPVQTEEELQPLQQAIDLRAANPREYEENVPEDIKAAVTYFEEVGEPTIAIQIGTEEVEVEKVLQNKPTLVVHNPQNVIIDPSCNGDLEKALFIIVSFETNKAELKKNPERYKNLDKVNWDTNTPVTTQDYATDTPDTFDFKDKTRKKVVAHEYWGFYDIEGNGSLVPIVATWIGDTIIRMELNPFPDQKLPFVLVPFMPVKRSLYGEPDAEILEDNQRTLGALVRGMIDLMARSANSQQGFAKGMLDPLNKRRYENGQDYEFNPNTHPSQGIIEHKYPELPNSALTMFQLQNQEAEALTGVKSFSGGMSGESYGKVATGIRGVLDAASKREMALLRRIAKGFVEIGNKIIAMNSEFLSDKEVIRVTNAEYVTVYRDELAGEFDLIVDISTAEVDDTKAQDLGFMLQTLGPNMDPRISMIILSKISDLKRMPELAEELRNWKPEPDPVTQELKQLEVERAKKEIEKLDSEIQLNMAKAQETMSKKDKTDLDFIEQETGTKHERDMAKQKAQAEGNQQLQITKALTTPTKVDQSPPDIEAAIGFNAIGDLLTGSGQIS